MVVLNRIYTRTGDKGTTALAAGGRRSKYDLRVEAYGTVDETNACIGMARLHTAGHEIDPMLARIQNDLFDLGSDLATVETGKPLPYTPLRITQGQVDRLEREIDQLNEHLSPLRSFVLPGGTAAAAASSMRTDVALAMTAAAWAHAHTPLLSVASPALKQAGDATLHLMLSDARQGRSLLDTGIKLHLIARVEGLDRAAFTVSPLN